MTPKAKLSTLLVVILLMGLLLGSIPAQASPLQQTATTGTPSPAATNTLPPNTSARLLIVVNSYYADTDVRPGSDFNLTVSLSNNGQHNAYNIILNFTPGDLIPRDTGGQVVVTQIIPGETKVISQPMTASSTLTAGTLVALPVSATYNDQSDGTAYSAAFNFSFRISGPRFTGPALPTATSTAILRPQLVISSYNTDVTTLQPGSEFLLKLEMRNLGTSNARGVSMVVGGGSTGSNNTTGTPEPGGISGTGGDFSTFAPLRSSNVQYLGDITTGEALQAEQALIVNVTANPGAYSLKFSFIYTDDKAQRYVDDQVITLLVYTLPLVEINFYRTPDPLYVGQPGALPLQIFNLGRKSAVFGNMRAAAENAELTNNVILIGPLEPGGYFPMDATIIPSQPGPLDVTITVGYTDDFNQPRTITQTLTVDVLDAPVFEPGTEGPGGGEAPIEPIPQAPETFWQKVGRFFKGLVGLDSSVPPSEPVIIPSEEEGPVKGEPSRPIVVPAGPKG